MENKLIGVVAVIALVVSVASWWGYRASPVNFGTATTAAGPNIENYIPAIMYNNGYVSAKDISTSANLNAAAATFSSTLQVTGASTLGGALTVTSANSATSTVSVGCVTTFATSTATPGHIAITTSTISTTTFAGTGIGGTAVWVFGACPF